MRQMYWQISFSLTLLFSNDAAVAVAVVVVLVMVDLFGLHIYLDLLTTVPSWSLCPLLYTKSPPQPQQFLSMPGAHLHMSFEHVSVLRREVASISDHGMAPLRVGVSPNAITRPMLESIFNATKMLSVLNLNRGSGC